MEIIEAMNQIEYLQEGKDGEYVFRIEADYRDHIETDLLRKIFSSDDPMDTLTERVFEAYDEEYIRMEDLLCTEVSDILEENGTVVPLEEIREEVQERVVFAFPLSHYLEQNVNLVIQVDTGDGNYDYTLNSVHPAFCGIEGEELDDSASIVWLAKQQGYTKEELQEALLTGSSNRFLNSVQEELLNVSSGINPLTFLCRTSLGEALGILKAVEEQASGYLLFSKDTRCGFFDDFNGGGSIFGIAPEWDVALPLSIIGSIWPDICAPQFCFQEVYSTGDEMFEPLKEFHT